MATKQAFIEELDGQTEETQAALKQIAETIAVNNTTIAELQTRRKALIHERVLNLLPDLSATALKKLENKLPGFSNVEQVDQLLANTQITYQNQLNRLLIEFDPAKCAGEKLRIRMEIAEIEADQRRIQEPLEEMRAIPDFTRLLAAGYGSKQYRVSWWRWQFYRDWKAADLAMSAAGMKRWEDLVEQYGNLTHTATLMKERTDSLNAETADLDSKSASHHDLTAALAKVPETVLEQLRVKFEARLESMDPVPEWMNAVGVLSGQLLELQDGNLKLQNARTKMVEQLTSLQKVRTQASRSKKRQVPDEYVKNLCSKRVGGFGGARGTVPNTVVVEHYYNDDYFLNLMLFQQMNNYFDQRDAYDAGYNARVEHEQAFTTAGADHSGQS